MSAKNQARPIPTIVVALVGVTVFVTALIASFERGATPWAQAQNQCDPSQAAGCEVDLNSTVQNAITDPAQTDTWNLPIPLTNDFTVTLTNLPGDYELTVYGPDGTMLGQADGTTGTSDKVVSVTNVGTGTYSVTVTSPNGDTSSQPYSLVVATIQSGPVATLEPTLAVVPTTVAFNSYGTPVPKPFLPY